MQKFRYVAVNLKKEKFTGTFIAADEKDLAVQLSKQNLFLVSASPYKEGTPSAFFTLGTGKVKMSELTMFCRQFSIMITSGIPVLGCIGSLKEQSYSKFFRRILEIIYDDVKSGSMLSEALKKHGKVFPDFFRSMVYVGEVSGKLDEVFASLADYYERDGAVKRKAAGALAYPLTLLFLTLAIVVVMMLFVIPAFRGALSTLEVEVSGFTKIVYAISDLVLGNWRTGVLAVILVGTLLFFYSRTERGKYTFDWLKLHFPFVKKVHTDIITARFTRGFGLLLSSGMDMAEAMDSVVVLLGNRVIGKKFRLAAEEVRRGSSLTDAIEKYRIFPEILIQMIAVGERTASVDEVLERSCKYFDEQVESTLMSFTSKIQPVMLLIMGVVVGGLFLAVYSPMLNIMDTLVPA